MRFTTTVLFIALALPALVFSQKLPSGWAEKLAGKNTKAQIRFIDSAAVAERTGNPRLSIALFRYNAGLSLRQNLPREYVLALLGTSKTFKSLASYDTALVYTDSAKKYVFAQKLDGLYGTVLDHEAMVRMRAGDYTKATECLYASIRYSEAKKDSMALHLAFDHLGTTHFYRSDFASAVKFYKKSLEYASKERSPAIYISTIDNIGLCYSNRDMPDSALWFQKQAIPVMESMHDSALLAKGYINIVSTYLLLKRYAEAEPLAVKAYDINNALHDEYGRMLANLYMGRLYLQTDRAAASIPFLLLADSIAAHLKIAVQVKETTSSLAEAYHATGDFQKEAVKLRELTEVMIGIYKDENARSINDLSARYDTEKKQQQIQLLTKDSELQQQIIRNDRYTKIIYAALAVLLLVVSVFFIYRFREKKRDHQLLQERNEAIEKQKNKIEQQKEELQEKNKEITDSINYAQRLQASVIPSEKLVKQLFPESFIYFRPKDIVSGDFYWLAEKKGSIYFAVADCTGHGVPGAMMSMLGTSLLNRILSGDKVPSPAEVLKELHYQVVRSLNENMETRGTKDGMDMALLLFDRGARKLFFAGAGRPLCIIRGGNMELIKSDRHSIGGVADVSEVTFTLHEVDLSEPLQVFLFTDGVTDQFGGPKGKKFMGQKLYDILNAPDLASIAAKEKRFITEFEQWKSGFEQTDDVTLVGIAT